MRLRTEHNPLSFKMTPVSISINTLAESNPSLEADLGRRYFVAKTKTGVCVVNYQPSLDIYVGGPFLTWGGASTYIDVYGENRRRKYLLGFGAVALALSGFAYLVV